MKLSFLTAAALFSSLALYGCGGHSSDVDNGPPTSKGSFSAIVSFGDSLVDVGTYAPATSLTGDGAPPYFGGKFTTNETSDGTPDSNALGKIWSRTWRLRSASSSPRPRLGSTADPSNARPRSCQRSHRAALPMARVARESPTRQASATTRTAPAR